MDGLVNWIQEFPNGKIDTDKLSNNPVSKRSTRKCVLIGYDTEFQGRVLGANKNLGLSGQYSIYDLETKNYHEDIIKFDYKNRKRITMKKLILDALKSIGVTGRSVNGFTIILVCHFSVIEWSMFSDRDDYVEDLMMIHKTCVSTKGIELSWRDGYGNLIEITVHFRDTYLLLPATHLSLSKASSFVDTQKMELEPNEIANMLYLLENDEPRYRKYSILDAVVTLKLFIMLQYELNNLSGTEDKTYLTIASSAINNYVAHIKGLIGKARFKNLFPPKYIRKCKCKRNHTCACKYKTKTKMFTENEDLAKRAYLGGLNTAFNIGTFTDGIFLDIDFSSAYPTIMNMLKVPDVGATDE